MCLEYCLIYSSCCCDKGPWQEPLKGKETYFGSVFKGPVHRGGESEQQERSAAGHSVLTIRSRRWGNACPQLYFLLPFTPGLSPGHSTIHSGQVSPAACPEIVFQGILNPNKLTVVLTVAVIWAHFLGLSSVGPKAQSSHRKDTCSEQRRRREKEHDWSDETFFYCKSNLTLIPCFGKLSKKCFSKPFLGTRLRGARLLWVSSLQTPGRNLGICRSSALFWPLYSVQFSEHGHSVFIRSGMIKQFFISTFTAIYQSPNPGGKLRKTLLAVKTVFVVIKILLEGDFQNGAGKSPTVPCQQNIHIVKTIIQSLQKAS